ncbi:MAG TPA: hypothetical protein VGD64_14095 [Acidisarcina sp.]
MLPGVIRSFFDGPRFKRDQPHNSAAEVIRWWESRRFFYNVIVGCTGIITCILMIACALTAEPVVGEAIGIPDGGIWGIFAIFFYGILANVFYTGGWISELALRTKITADRSAAFGVKAFRAGVAFSIFITLCPAAVCWVGFGIAVLHGQKHGPPGE